MQNKSTTFKFGMENIPEIDIIILSCDVSTQHIRPFIPKEFREMAMKSS